MEISGSTVVVVDDGDGDIFGTRSEKGRDVGWVLTCGNGVVERGRFG